MFYELPTSKFFLRSAPAQNKSKRAHLPCQLRLKRAPPDALPVAFTHGVLLFTTAPSIFLSNHPTLLQIDPIILLESTTAKLHGKE
jgi:hypothetical protein